MSIGTMIEVMSRGVLHSILIAGILKQEGVKTCVTTRKGTYSVLLLIVHEGCDSMTLIGMMANLTMDMDGSMANTKMVGGTQNSVEGGRHLSK